MEKEKTAEQLQAEEQELRRKRGDFVGEEEEVQEPEAESAVSAAEAEEEGEELADEEGEEEESVEAVAEEDLDVGEPGEAPPEPEAKEAEEEPITIPKSRFDEAQRKARERQEDLERRIREMESQQVQKTTKDDADNLQGEIDELESKFVSLLMEGEEDKAKAIRKEMRTKETDLFDMRLTQRSTQASQVAVEQMRFDAQLAQFEAKHPIINPDATTFDQEVANEVADVMKAFQAGKGLTPAAALNKAVHYVIGDLVTGESAKPTKDPEVVRQKRGQQARRTAAKAAAASPPDITDKGRDSDKAGTGDGLPDPTKMTPEQFDNLTEDQVRQMRGDKVSDEAAA
jgi:hypothetical protein